MSADVIGFPRPPRSHRKIVCRGDESAVRLIGLKGVPYVVHGPSQCLRIIRDCLDKLERAGAYGYTHADTWGLNLLAVAAYSAANGRSLPDPV